MAAEKSGQLNKHTHTQTNTQKQLIEVIADKGRLFGTLLTTNITARTFLKK